MLEIRQMADIFAGFTNFILDWENIVSWKEQLSIFLNLSRLYDFNVNSLGAHDIFNCGGSESRYLFFCFALA